MIGLLAKSLPEVIDISGRVKKKSCTQLRSWFCHRLGCIHNNHFSKQRSLKAFLHLAATMSDDPQRIQLLDCHGIEKWTIPGCDQSVGASKLRDGGGIICRSRHQTPMRQTAQTLLP